MSIQARTEASIDDIERVFYQDRQLLRHTTIRRTVFAMPLDVFPLAHGAFNHALATTLRSTLAGWIDASPDTATPGGPFLDAVEAQVSEALRNTDGLTGTELSKAIPDLRVRFDPAPRASYSKPMRITSKVLEVMAAEGRTIATRLLEQDDAHVTRLLAAEVNRLQNWLGDVRVKWRYPTPLTKALAQRVGRPLVQRPVVDQCQASLGRFSRP